MNAGQLTNEAADWFARLQTDATAADREAFDAWLLSSPAHIEAYIKVSRTWGDLGFADAPSVDALVAGARAEPDTGNIATLPSRSVLSRAEGSSFRRTPFTYATAAAVAAALVTSAAWFFADRWLPPSHLQTQIGEQRSITLADGSIVHLNTDSEVRFDLDDKTRRISLGRGEARFTVAKDSRRPFTVVTPQTTVRAVGTVFNVQTSSDRTAVTVLEGRVALSRAGDAPVELAVGQQAAVTGKGQILRDAGPSVEQAMAWPQRQLVFRDQPLSEVVAEFNRYHTEPIRIDGAELAALKINGVFDARDSASLIEYLQRYRDVKAEPLAGSGQVISIGR